MPRLATAIVLAALLVGASAARAQFGGSVGIETDRRFRGVSISDEKPAAHVSLDWDSPAGWYAGAQIGNAALEPGDHQAELLGYAGYAGRTPAGAGWELGLTATHFSGEGGYDYAEFYAGLVAPRWSARVYLSPDYFGRSTRSAYLEFNGSMALPMTTLRAVGHAGVLQRSGDGVQSAAYDGRLGLALDVDALRLQLAWVGSSLSGADPALYGQRRSTVVLSAVWVF